MYLRSQARRRPGTVLVLFAMLSFCLLGLAALIIDLGLVRTTQQRMQVATEAAALEGMRGRDLDVTDPSVYMNAAASEAYRRQQASNMAAYMFRDTLTTDQDLNYFGAGPEINYSGGIQVGSSNLYASQSYTTPPGVYKPTPETNQALQTNADNAMEGDMVAGTYVDSATTNHVEGQSASSPFVRDDFMPSSSETANQANSFLVRMRRSTDPAESGISSTGPPMSYLFARGSALAPNSDAAGVTVRATGIAQAQPVSSVGQPITTDGSGNALPTPQTLPGAAPFVLRFSQWQNSSVLPAGQSITVAAQPDGTLTLTDTNQTAIGYATPAQAYVTLAQPTAPNSNPPAPAAWVSSTLAQFPRGFGYVPIIDTLGSPAQDLVVGFGFVNLAANSSNQSQFTMTIGNSLVAPDNASAAVVGPVPAGLPLVLNDLQQQPLTNGLLTPILVRSIGPSSAPPP